MKKSLSEKLSIRVSESDIYMLDIVSSEFGLDKSNLIRFLINREYQKIINSNNQSIGIIKELKKRWVKSK